MIGTMASRMKGTLSALALVLVALFATTSCGGAGEPQRMPLQDAVGQMLLIGFRGTELDNPTANFLQEISPGGVVLFDYDLPSEGAVLRNVKSPEQLRSLIGSLQDRASIPLFVAIDAEGGYVNRLKPTYGFRVDVPSHQVLGEQSPGSTGSIATALAAQLRWLGVNWNLAPVVDVNVNLESPAIGALERSFSIDPGLVAAHATEFVEAHNDAGIIPTLKHFPGHGSATGDTHLGVTDVTSTFKSEIELAPYRSLIDGGYSGAIMTAHLVNRKLDPTGTPATLSHPVVTELLRDGMNFGGVVVSDDMQMGAIVEEYELEGAAVAAVQAGVDVLLVAQQANGDPDQIRRIKEAILEAVSDGRISEDRIYESVERILALKREYGIVREGSF